MFESEVELEKQASLINARFILVLVLVAAVVIGGGWYVWRLLNPPLTQDKAAAVIQSMLKSKGPATVEFHMGELVYDDDPHGPLYNLLEKAGYVTLGKAAKGGTKAEVTPLGTETFSQIPGFQKKAYSDGSEKYTVPLAERELVAVSGVAKDPNSPHKWIVAYTWKWKPNQVGEIFDINSSLVKKFGQYERSELIQKYGVDYYLAEPTKEKISVAAP
jgi:hypothetical protein